MTTNELKVLSIIWDWGGEASVDIIARGAGISLDYARILCESLKREDCVDFLYSKLCKIKSKGKIAVAEKRSPALKGRGSLNEIERQNPQKIVIPERPSKFGLGKDKRGRLILNYG